MNRDIAVGVVSLGCDKNRIDTEEMLGRLAQEGFRFTRDAAQADVIIVNTCAFIDSAKEEAISTLLEMAEYKKDGKCKFLIATGCLPQRYMQELSEGMPEVDAWLGTAGYDKIADVIRRLYGGEKGIAVANDKDDRCPVAPRMLTTPEHYAYLKIAEGCGNRCTYCAIPSIRGGYTSRPIESVVEEAKTLTAEHPIKELIVVAQDVSRYGEDLYGENRLIDLLGKLCELPVEWIRLLYLYPEKITDELLDFIDSHPKICRYLDIPLQHYSDRVLKRMNRRITSEGIDALIAKIAARGGYTLRSTFIVGFPGETDEDIELLEAFLKRARLDRCGFFEYSKEDGTAAARLPEQVPEEVKHARFERLYALQEGIMSDKDAQKVGSVLEVIYEDIDFDNNMFSGRTRGDAPSVDSGILFTSERPMDVGEICRVKVTGAKDGILTGECI